MKKRILKIEKFKKDTVDTFKRWQMEDAKRLTNLMNTIYKDRQINKIITIIICTILLTSIILVILMS